MKLLILGAGSHGQVIKEVAKTLRLYEKIDFLDDYSEDAIGMLDEYKKYIEEYENAFIALGNSELREKWQSALNEYGYEIPTLVHPSAVLSTSSQIDIGTVVMAGAIIQSNVMIGKGCIISAGAIVDHDVIVHDYCHINAGTIVASMTNIPRNTKVDYGIVFK